LVSEITTTTENSATPENNFDVLPETLRQQYLKLMGVQTWFDPELLTSAAACPPPSAETVNHQQKLKTELKPAVKPEPVRADQKQTETIDALSATVKQCQLCELHTTRQCVVVGEGNVSADLMVISDAPVNDSVFSIEDKNMLQAMLQAIGLKLSSVYITSLVKCQPPAQCAPQTSEMICCDDHLSAQIKLVQPEVILVLGELACQQLLVSQKSLTDLRLRHHKHLGIPVYASYHPRSLLHSSETKRKVWADLLQINKLLSIQT